MKTKKGFQKGSLNPTASAAGRLRASITLTKQSQSSEFQKLKVEGIRKFWKTGLGKKEAKKRSIRALQREESPHLVNIKSGGYRKKNQKLSSLKAKAWKLWSKYRRSSAASFSGYAPCFTCGRSNPWQEMDLGHYKHGKLDFDEMNTNPQCVYCNRYLHGNLDNYSMKLIEKYGIEAVKDLHRRAAQHPGYTREELYEIIEKFSNLK